MLVCFPAGECGGLNTRPCIFLRRFVSFYKKNRTWTVLSQSFSRHCVGQQYSWFSAIGLLDVLFGPDLARHKPVIQQIFAVLLNGVALNTILPTGNKCWAIPLRVCTLVYPMMFRQLMAPASKYEVLC